MCRILQRICSSDLAYQPHLLMHVGIPKCLHVPSLFTFVSIFVLKFRRPPKLWQDASFFIEQDASWSFVREHFRRIDLPKCFSPGLLIFLHFAEDEMLSGILYRCIQNICSITINYIRNFFVPWKTTYFKSIFNIRIVYILYPSIICTRSHKIRSWLGSNI